MVFFGALINISGEWYHCSFEKKYIDDKLTPCVLLSDSAEKALNLATSKPVFIRLDSITEEEFETFYKDLIQSIKEKANALEFTYIDITHNYICGSDCKDDFRYLNFNDKALKILDAFNALDDFDDRMNFTSKFEGYDTTYRIGTNIDKLFELAGPKLKEIEAKREERRRKEEKIRRVKEAIKNGAISFHCESAPHDEDLSEAILTRPCPNSGSFTLTHRVPAEVFSKIKKFGVYYDHDFLEECDHLKVLTTVTKEDKPSKASLHRFAVAVRKAYESGINIIGKTHALTSFGKKIVDAAPCIKESKNTYFSSAAPRRYYDKNTLVYMKLEQIEQNDN